MPLLKARRGQWQLNFLSTVFTGITKAVQADTPLIVPGVVIMTAGVALNAL